MKMSPADVAKILRETCREFHPDPMPSDWNYESSDGVFSRYSCKKILVNCSIDTVKNQPEQRHVSVSVENGSRDPSDEELLKVCDAFFKKNEPVYLMARPKNIPHIGPKKIFHLLARTDGLPLTTMPVERMVRPPC